MLNPLLHPNHCSAPTSPVCTRSVLSGKRSNIFVFGGNGSANTAPHSPLVGFHSSGPPTALLSSSPSNGFQPPAGFVKPVLLRAIPGSVIRRRRMELQNGGSGKQRRLSRIVKVYNKICSLICTVKECKENTCHQPINKPCRSITTMNKCI